MNPPPGPIELLRQRIAEFEKPLRQAEAGRVRAVHRARVASRRLREILPALGAQADECRGTLKRLGKVTRQLGRLRELDVSAGLLDDVRDSARGESTGVRLVRQRLARARQAAFDKAERKGFGRKLRRTAKELARLADGLSEGTLARHRRWRWALDARMANRAGALLVAMDEAGVAFVPGRVHNVRIALKKLRYAVELAEAAAGLAATVELRRLMAAQSRLGRLHDRQVLMAFVANVQTSLGSRDLRARRELRSLSADLDAECRVLHAAYVRSRAALREVCRRVLVRTEGVRATGPHARVPSRLRQVRLA